MSRLSILSRSVVDVPVLITGAAWGMGRATAHLFADEGATVAVTDVDSDGVEAVVAEIVDAGGTAQGWRLDVSDATEVRTTVEAVASTFGGLAVVVNNGHKVGQPLHGGQTRRGRPDQVVGR